MCRSRSISVCIRDSVSHSRLIVGHQFATTPGTNATLVAPGELFFRCSILLKGREAVVAKVLLAVVFRGLGRGPGRVHAIRVRAAAKMLVLAWRGVG